MKLTKNNYVAPYSYYANDVIQDSDISALGVPISISATGDAGAPVPSALFINADTKKYMYTVISSGEKAEVLITFFKI